jgi:hypothetical protein
MLRLLIVEPLRSHLEILHLKLLDPVIENFVLISALDEFLVHAIYCHVERTTAALCCCVLLLSSWRLMTRAQTVLSVSKPAILLLRIALFNLTPDTRTEHLIKLLRVVLQYAFHNLQSFPKLLVLQVQLYVLGLFVLVVSLHSLHMVSQVSVRLK